MDHAEAERFVDRWLRNWNAHDVDAVLADFTDDALFTSPVALRVTPESGGILRGKDAIRNYWNAALRGLPDLHFELVDYYLGVSTLVINYRNQRGGLVNEVLILQDDQVIEGHGTYATE